MIPHGTIAFPWADKTYTFRIAYGEWGELDRALKLGPIELYQKLLRQQWRAHELREIIRVALIGGGLDPSSALSLVGRYVEQRPILESAKPALLIMEAALIVEHETEIASGEAEAAKTDQEGSTLPPYSETVQ